MNLLYNLIISISLCFDTFTLAVTCGLILKKIHWSEMLKIAFAFAFPQTLFLFLGWLGGENVGKFISSVDHWLALAILGVVGGKMIYEGLKSLKEEEELLEEKKFNPKSFGVLISLGCACSFDALAIGVSFGLLGTEILEPLIVLLIVTFFIAGVGVYIGGKFEKVPNEKIAIIGGILIIAIGIKIFVEDLISLS